MWPRQRSSQGAPNNDESLLLLSDTTAPRQHDYEFGARQQHDVLPPHHHSLSSRNAPGVHSGFVPDDFQAGGQHHMHDDPASYSNKSVSTGGRLNDSSFPTSGSSWTTPALHRGGRGDHHEQLHTNSAATSSWTGDHQSINRPGYGGTPSPTGGLPPIGMAGGPMAAAASDDSFENEWSHLDGVTQRGRRRTGADAWLARSTGEESKAIEVMLEIILWAGMWGIVDCLVEFVAIAFFPIWFYYRSKVLLYSVMLFLVCSSYYNMRKLPTSPSAPGTTAGGEQTGPQNNYFEKLQAHRGSMFFDWVARRTHPEVVTFLIGVLMSSGSWGIFDTIVEYVSGGDKTKPLRIALVYVVLVSAAFYGVWLHHQRRPGVLLEKIGKIEWT